MPARIISGENALELSKETLKGLGSKALIVSDDMMLSLGNIAKLEKYIRRARYHLSYLF